MAGLMGNPVEWYLGLTHSGRYKAFSENFALNQGYLERNYSKIWGPFRSMNAAQSYIEDLEDDAESTRRRRRLEGNPPRRAPSGPLRRNPAVSAVEIYDQVLAIEARKGGRSLWPKENFRHDFKGGKSKAKVFGLADGSILIKGPKRLWKEFDYGPDDVA